MLGNKNVHMLKPHEHRPEIHAQVRAALEAPSFYDEVVRMLARRGFPIHRDWLERDWTLPTTYDESVEAAWLTVYRDPKQHWELYEIAEELVDLEDMIYLETIRSETALTLGLAPGSRLSMLTSSMGSAYLAVLDVPEREVLFVELGQSEGAA